ncbi:MAG: hypothetical protein H7289_08045 [Mucilaginibacter sp.]|nr:hypothetical protein [Mucilaginibacter sp.]
MSLKSFLSKIWNEIKNLFASIPVELKTAIHIGVIAAENIKTFVDSPAADILTTLIPGDIDDKIKDVLRSKIPLILSELKLVDDCQNITDPTQLTTCAIKALQGLDGNIKSSFLHTISILVAEVATDGQLTWSDGVYLSEWYYQHKYKAD